MKLKHTLAILTTALALGACGETLDCVQEGGLTLCFEGAPDEASRCAFEDEGRYVCRPGFATRAEGLASTPDMVINPYGNPYGISGCGGAALCAQTGGGGGGGAPPPLSCIKCGACVVASVVTGGTAALVCGGSCITCAADLIGAAIQ